MLLLIAAIALAVANASSPLNITTELSLISKSCHDQALVAAANMSVDECLLRSHMALDMITMGWHTMPSDCLTCPQARAPHARWTLLI